MKILSQNKKTILYCIGILAVICCVGFVKINMQQKNTAVSPVTLETQNSEIIERITVSEEVETVEEVAVTETATAEDESFSVSDTLKGI